MTRRAVFTEILPAFPVEPGSEEAEIPVELFDNLPPEIDIKSVTFTFNSPASP
jgi:hypothetical protein